MSRLENENYFVIITDAHIGWGLSDGFENVVSTLLDLDPKPMFIVNLGDMGHRNDREKNSCLYKEMITKISKSDIPLYHLCGNHDVGNEPFLENYEWYRKTFGDIYYSFEMNNIGFIALETNMMNKPNEETEKMLGEQMKWIRSEVKKLTENNKLVIPLMHTPLLLTYWKSKCHFIVPSKISEELRSLFQESKKIEMVFSGHYHMRDFVEEKGIKFHTVSSCAAPLTQPPKDPREKFKAGIGIVKISKEYTPKFKFYSNEELIQKCKNSSGDFLNFGDE